MREAPLHVQMLLKLRNDTEQRQRMHEKKAGKGLEDRDYQRHVGRIAECEAQLAAINELLRADADDIADALEESQRVDQGDRSRNQRRRQDGDTPRARPGQ